MATAERTIYVCDQCGNEEDQEEINAQETWIEVCYSGNTLQFCGDCWSFV